MALDQYPPNPMLPHNLPNHGVRRISPLDLNKNIKIGVALPIDENNMNTGTDTVKEQIKSNLINLLLTSRGERLNLPTYGVGLKNLLFEVHSEKLDSPRMNQIIDEQIKRYLPEVNLIDTYISFEEEKHILYIKIVYSIMDGFEDGIQINFAYGNYTNSILDPSGFN